VHFDFSVDREAARIGRRRYDNHHPRELFRFQIARDILGRSASSQTIEAIQRGHAAGEVTPAFIAGLILGSPDFQKK
jgi:hypothetical protein